MALRSRADDLFYQIIIADQRFLLRRRLALAATGDRRDRLLAEAYQSYTRLIDADLGVPRDRVRAVVLAKLINAAPDDTPLEALPAIVTVARAQHLVAAPQTADAGLALLRQVLARDDLDDAQRAAVLFGLAKAHHAHDQPLLAAERFIELAREHPTDHQAERSIEIGVTIAANLYRARPTGESARAMLNDGLQLLLERYSNLATVDRWRYTAGQLAVR